MISEKTLKHIANVFIGDEGDYYPYKKGSEIVNFFNTYFGGNDQYGPGFPSRWYYVYNKLVVLINANSFDQFINIILSTRYIMSERRCTEVEAFEILNSVKALLITDFEADGYTLSEKGGRFHLVLIDDDLVLIGQGGFAKVYFQKSTGKVLKKLHEEFMGDSGVRSRFKREYNLTKSLYDVGGIITVYNYYDNNCSYTMEFAETTLEKFMRDYDHDEDTKIRIIRMILNIMKIVHARDIIHRDLSPNNIFIIHGQIKIADFGLGKDLNVLNSHQTQLTNAVGQLLYCAPEQFMMLRDGDKRSDVFSLGRILNYIMTGRPDDVSHLFRVISEKATSSDSAYRYADAGQMLYFLEKTIEYNKSANRKDHAKELMKKGVFDESQEAFIYEQSGVEICKWIINKVPGYERALHEFMKIDDEHALHIIQSIDKEYRNLRLSFEEYDPIAEFAYSVMNLYSYMVSYTAANILRYIAFDVNRFNAQGLIRDIIESGVEPTIEEMMRA